MHPFWGLKKPVQAGVNPTTNIILDRKAKTSLKLEPGRIYLLWFIILSYLKALTWVIEQRNPSIRISIHVPLGRCCLARDGSQKSCQCGRMPGRAAYLVLVFPEFWHQWGFSQIIGNISFLSGWGNIAISHTIGLDRLEACIRGNLDFWNPVTEASRPQASVSAGPQNGTRPQMVLPVCLAPRQLWESRERWSIWIMDQERSSAKLLFRWGTRSFVHFKTNKKHSLRNCGKMQNSFLCHLQDPFRDTISPCYCRNMKLPPPQRLAYQRLNLKKVDPIMEKLLGHLYSALISRFVY